LIMSASIEYPFTLDKIRAFKVGDELSISGRIVTARDRVHWHLFEGGKSPVELKDGCIFHCGPVVVRDAGGWFVRAAGPATSMRHDLYMPRIIEQHGVRMIIGKGGMGKATQEACVRCGCVYLQAVGGTAASLAEKITAVHKAHLVREFGIAEALWELEADSLEAIVTIDTHGGNLHGDVEESSLEIFRTLLK